MLCPMANGMYGREELSPVICLFLSDGDALCRVPVIPEIYRKPSHHSRLRMDLRRAVGVDGFPSLRYILIAREGGGGVLMRFCACSARGQWVRCSRASHH